MAEYFRGTSDNLPEVDFIAILEFLNNNPNFSSAEFRGAKASRSAKAEYGDKAIGYVEVKREGTICFVRGRVTPEHKVRNKAYVVSTSIDEDGNKILTAECQGCAASAGGCKHVMAFLFWLHRRTEEPSPTEVTSYWKKSALASVGSTKVSLLDELFGPKNNPPERETNALEEAKNFFLPGNSSILACNWADKPFKNVSLHLLIMAFKKSGCIEDGLMFLNFAASKMSLEVCSSLEEQTREQCKSSLWFEARFGRVTASNIHQCIHYSKGESLLDAILGAGRPIDTAAMARGREMEPHVLKHVSELLKVSVAKCGFFTDPEFPFIGASPDGITNDFIVEIKCPTKDHSKNYIKDGVVAAKFYSQVQLQMFLTKKKKGLFVVADPDFSLNKQLTMKWLDIDIDYVLDLISEARGFWLTYIFPLLFESI